MEAIVAALPAECAVTQCFVHDLEFRPCTGCMKCRSALRCALPEDDAHRIAIAIREADVLIVGSPCYWGNMNGRLKMLFDRSVCVLMGEKPNGMPVALHRGQRALLVTACNTVWPFSVWCGQTRGVFRALGEVLRWSGYRVAGRVAKSGCRKHPGLGKRELEKCKKLAKKIC